jgi:predicted acylesterase/phospholipase RssA
MDKTQYPFPCRFSSMVISGGSVKALSAVGCIQYLEEVDILKHVINFLGTSAGSILCLLVVLGFSANDIMQFIREEFNQEDVVQLDIEEALMIFEKYGISSGANISKLVGDMLQRKLNRRDITFMELAKTTGKNLIVCVANLSDNREEFWSVNTVPQMSVSFAIRTSCSLPFIFTPMKYKDNIYVDGGIYNNFPIDYFCTDVLKDVIGINIACKSSPKTEIQDFFSYASLIIGTAINQLMKPYKDDLKNNVVTLELHDGSWLSLIDMRITLPRECIDKNILIGYEEMKNKLDSHCQKVAELMTKNFTTTSQMKEEH